MKREGDTSTACNPQIFEITPHVTTAGLAVLIHCMVHLMELRGERDIITLPPTTGVVPSTLGQGSPSDEDYNTFVLIPLAED